MCWSNLAMEDKVENKIKDAFLLLGKVVIDHELLAKLSVTQGFDKCI